MRILTIFLTVFFSYFPQAWAASCAVEISGSDSMMFDAKEIKVDSACAEFSLSLTHTGGLPANIMGHNVVIVKESDFKAVVASINMSHGAAEGYLSPESPVLAKTALIGGGETTKVNVDAGIFEKGELYTFFCSFPGHYTMMKGSFAFN
jgi:azurin